MNLREPPHLPGGVRRALHCLTALLLQALAPDVAIALPRIRPPGSGPDLRNAEPLPYLPRLNAPPLRFQEATPPPDLVTRPPAAAPPTPALSLTETSVAQANAAAAHTTGAGPPAGDTSTKPDSGPPPNPAPAASPAQPPAKPPVSILPDSVRPTVRPEDFLPYFQIPGSVRAPADVTLGVPAAPSAPAPATLPPSSATYRQR